MITSVNNGQVKNIIQKPGENKGFLLQRDERCLEKLRQTGSRRCTCQRH